MRRALRRQHDFVDQKLGVPRRHDLVHLGKHARHVGIGPVVWYSVEEIGARAGDGLRLEEVVGHLADSAVKRLLAMGGDHFRQVLDNEDVGREVGVAIQQALGVEALSATNVDEKGLRQVGACHKGLGIIDVRPEHLVLSHRCHDALERAARFGVILDVAKEVPPEDIAVVIKGRYVKRLSVTILGQEAREVTAAGNGMIQAALLVSPYESRRHSLGMGIASLAHVPSFDYVASMRLLGAQGQGGGCGLPCINAHLLDHVKGSDVPEEATQQVRLAGCMSPAKKLVKRPCHAWILSIGLCPFRPYAKVLQQLKAGNKAGTLEGDGPALLKGRLKAGEKATSCFFGSKAVSWRCELARLNCVEGGNNIRRHRVGSSTLLLFTSSLLIHRIVDEGNFYRSEDD